MNDFMMLAAEAEMSGAPILRHLMLVFPNDPETWDISDQFMIGTKLLVAPVTEDGARSRSVYFPAGSGGQRLTVEAPIGSPPVYARDQDRDDLRNWQTLTYADCR
jgi:alpha-glucosidase (family GH31 glycosyl hydrolase)